MVDENENDADQVITLNYSAIRKLVWEGEVICKDERERLVKVEVRDE